MSIHDPAALRPVIRSLKREEIEAILARNHVGRIAYSRGGMVNVEPLHYVYRAPWIYARTSAGDKSRLLEESYCQACPLAFEVDEAEAFFRWRSVIVHGTGYLLLPPEEGGDEAEWAEAIDQLRTLLPATFTDDDPVPFRTVLLRIAVQEATGRESVALL